MSDRQLDLLSDASRQVVMRVLLHELAPAWHLSATDVAEAFLLTEADQSAWSELKSAPLFTEDQLSRFWHVFLLHQALCDAFADRQLALDWINRPNTSAVTQGATALSFLKSRQFEDAAWRELIGYVMGGLYG